MWEDNAVPPQRVQVIRQTPQCQPWVVIMVLLVIEVPQDPKVIQAIVIIFGGSLQLDCNKILL